MSNITTGNLALKPIVIQERQSVTKQLLEIAGLSQQDFINAISAANISRSDETSHSTKGYAGTIFYHNLIKELRDILATKDFTAYHHRSIELVINEQIAIAICKGDENTGNMDQAPYSARKKGGVTLELFGLKHNENPVQEKLFAEESPLKINHGKLQLKLDDKERDVWVLMHYSEKLSEGDYKVLAELSQPATYNSQGFINSFAKRIILDINHTGLDGLKPEFIDDIDFKIE